MLYLTNADEERLVSRMERVFSRRWHYALVTADHQSWQYVKKVTMAGYGSPRSRLYSEWRAIQNKTANSYVIEITL
jgi:hypothetical protein